MNLHHNKVVEVDNEDFDELTDITQQQSDEETYLEILGEDDEEDVDVYDEMVIAPEEGILEDEN